MPVYRKGHKGALASAFAQPIVNFAVMDDAFDTFTPAEAGALDRLALRIEAEHLAREVHEELFLDRFQDRKVS